MHSRIAWNALTPTMPTSDAELLLESIKSYKVTKSHLVSCGVCNHARPHAMRVRLLACNCKACASVVPYAPCPWRGRTLACQHLNLMRVEEAEAHITPAPSPEEPRLTAAMKEVAREWVAQGLKPSRIRSGFLCRFDLDEASLPPLAKVQRFVHNYAANHLNNNDILSALRTKIHEVAFTGGEQESEAFKFSWQNDAAGLPIVDNGSDDEPFIIGVTTKKLLQRADRDPSSFGFHVDATYKLFQAAYPVLVVGISDKLHYASTLSAIRRVYMLVMGKPLIVRMCVDCNVVHLMCFFHVAKKIYEKAKGFSPELFAMGLQDLHELHFTTSNREYEDKMTSVLLNWAKWPELSKFTSYFRATWLTGAFRQWQIYHTPPGFAATNNPVEQYNAVLKRDVTVHRKLKMGLLLDRLLEWCRLESARTVPFATTAVADARLQRRAREMERQDLLSEWEENRLSVAFVLDDHPAVPVDANSVRVRSVLASHPYDEEQRRRHEDLPASAQLGQNTARMEIMGMPASGWTVNLQQLSCPCRFHQKFGACIHVLFGLNLRGHIDLFDRERLVYRGATKKRRRGSTRQGPGRPAANGHALAIN